MKQNISDYIKHFDFDFDKLDKETKIAIEVYKVIMDRDNYKQMINHAYAWLRKILQDESSEKEKVKKYFEPTKKELDKKGVFFGLNMDIMGESPDEEALEKYREEALKYDPSIEKLPELRVFENQASLSHAFIDFEMEEDKALSKFRFKLRKAHLNHLSNICFTDPEFISSGNSVSRDYMFAIGAGGGTEFEMSLYINETEYNLMTDFEYNLEYDFISSIEHIQIIPYRVTQKGDFYLIDALFIASTDENEVDYSEDMDIEYINADQVEDEEGDEEEENIFSNLNISRVSETEDAVKMFTEVLGRDPYEGKTDEVFAWLCKILEDKSTFRKEIKDIYEPFYNELIEKKLELDLDTDAINNHELQEKYRQRSMNYNHSKKEMNAEEVKVDTLQDKKTKTKSKDIKIKQENGKLISYSKLNDNQEYSIPEGIKVIGEDSFIKNTNLKRVFIPSSVEIIENMAFYGCENLTEVIFDSDIKLEQIGYSAFSNCKSLAAFTLPNSLQVIEQSTFQDCKNLQQFEIGNDSNLRKIEFVAFSGCESLSSISLPEKLEVIEAGAFHETNIKNIHLTKNVKTVEGYFLTTENDYEPTITVAESNDYFTIEDGILFSADMKQLVGYPRYLKVPMYKIPESVESIGKWAFFDNQHLRHIDLYNGGKLKKMYKFAIGSCNNIKKIILPKHITDIEDGATGRLKGLKYVVVTTPKKDEPINLAGGFDLKDTIAY
ncbi:MAG: leucine-rich repeat domain-containing protein, partial [archaeon]